MRAAVVCSVLLLFLPSPLAPQVDVRVSVGVGPTSYSTEGEDFLDSWAVVPMEITWLRDGGGREVSLRYAFFGEFDPWGDSRAWSSRVIPCLESVSCAPSREWVRRWVWRHPKE